MDVRAASIGMGKLGDTVKSISISINEAIIASIVGSMYLSCSSPGQVGASSGGVEGAGGITVITTNITAGGSGSAGAGGSTGITIKVGAGASGSTGAGNAGASGSTGSAGSAGTCETTTGGTTRAPADMLLVLDRSLSMTWSIAADSNCSPRATNCTDRWTAVRTAVTATIGATPSIEWGLELFASPDGGNCGVVAAPQVPIGANSGAMIQAQIAAVAPSSYTPTAAAINAATAYLKTVNDSNNKAILLATDGEPNCGSGMDSSASDLPNTLTALSAASAAGFPVYVIGIAPSGANLSSMAQAGGTADYYPATSPQQLSDALAKISTVVGSCSFTAVSPPPDPTLVSVYVDKQLVPQDANNGWTFGATNSTILLTGTYCDNVMSGTSSQVEILFGCPNVAPPTVIP